MEKNMGPRFGHAFLWACHNLGHETFLELHMIGDWFIHVLICKAHTKPLNCFRGAMVRAVAAGKHTVPCKHSSSICWRGSYAGCEQELKTSESLHESDIFMQLLSYVHSETLQGSVSSWGKKKIIFTPRCCAF